MDSRQFSAAADAVLAASEPDALLDVTSAALALWRGRPYDGVVDDGWLEPTRVRLAEQHLILRRAHISSLLAAGAPEQAASVSATALADHPYDEMLWRQRILSLYRTGRPTDALAAYREVRRLLTSELGVEPGSVLRQLHEQVCLLYTSPSPRD